MERLDTLLESRRIELPGKKEVKSAGQKGAGKEVVAGREEQESRPCLPLKKREARSASRNGPIKKRPGKGENESSPIRGVGDRKEEQWTKVLGRKAKRENKTGGGEEEEGPCWRGG